MVSLECLLYQVVDLAGGIHLCLRCTLIEDVVEVELAVISPLRDLHLPPGFVAPDAAIHIPRLNLALEEGSDADACLDLTAHLIILFRDKRGGGKWMGGG